ncbi:4'-phosphopantetheinyl transferase family protein [Pantoea sp. NSTU24]|uniref:4'-phosphopantetheinyl transferase family protein n=1 Tax=Pantoea sp. NSTU24 TaxID=3391144 RepID=UPI003CFC2C2B
MHFPDQPLPPVAGGFILSQRLHHNDPLLAIGCFDPQHYRDALAEAWGIRLPERLQRAVVKRRAEYLASRLLVRAVMAEFGIADFILTNAPDRSPRWPEGIQASLSHTTGTLVVAATRQNLAIGVDVERWMAENTAHETAGYLMNAREQQLLRTLPVSFNAAATLLFSLKESLYKALWPQLHQPMEFTDAALVTVDWSQQRALLRLTRTFSTDFPAGTTLQATFLWQPHQVITQVTHPVKPG